ncbi:hypothetical protein BgiMline_003287, partial [Biomphalaria glabrata]
LSTTSFLYLPDVRLLYKFSRHMRELNEMPSNLMRPLFSVPGRDSGAAFF